MPKNIIIFSSIDEAQKILKYYNDNFNFPNNNYTKEEIINKSVGSNVFRAFSNLPIPPSQIYREWIKNHFEFFLKNLSKIQSQKEYDKFIFKISFDFIFSWKNQMKNNNKNLTFGAGIKIINLFVKMIQETNDFKMNNIYDYMHVPYDKYSLKPLVKIINDLTELNFKIVIPNNVTMGYITNPELYLIIHHAVKKLCNHINMKPIIYDYWSWDDKH
jgi:hypothetical protein